MREGPCLIFLSVKFWWWTMSAAFVRFLQDVLTSAGYDVVTAEDGFEALLQAVQC